MWLSQVMVIIGHRRCTFDPKSRDVDKNEPQFLTFYWTIAFDDHARFDVLQ